MKLLNTLDVQAEDLSFVQCVAHCNCRIFHVAECQLNNSSLNTDSYAKYFDLLLFFFSVAIALVANATIKTNIQQKAHLIKPKDRCVSRKNRIH